MQKTEKHCKNQCFCYHKTTKISPKTGPKTQKSASGPGHLRNRKKRCCKPKNWGQKVEKHGFFHFSLADFGRARSRTGVFRTVFYSVFWRRASRPIKNRRFWPKNGTPPPGKPVTFYECHPDDRAPAPSVRADFYTWIIVFIDGLLLLQGDFYYKWITIKIKKGLHMDCNWIMLWMDCKWIQCKWIVLWIIDVLMVKLVGWSRPDI